MATMGLIAAMIYLLFEAYRWKARYKKLLELYKTIDTKNDELRIENNKLKSRINLAEFSDFEGNWEGLRN